MTKSFLQYTFFCWCFLYFQNTYSQTATLVYDVYSGTQSGTGYFSNSNFVLNDSLILFPGETFFTGAELYRTNGSNSGTYITKDIYTGTTSCWNGVSANRPIAFKNALLFKAQAAGDGMELWRSDGSDTGTYLLKDFNPGLSINSAPLNFVTPDNRYLFFTANIMGVSNVVCRSDGTTAGTVQAGFTAGALPNIALNGKYYFTKRNTITGIISEIWSLDTLNWQETFLVESDSVLNSGQVELIDTFNDSLILYKAKVNSIWHLFTFNVFTMQVQQLTENYAGTPNLQNPGNFYRVPGTDTLLFSATTVNEGNETWICNPYSTQLLIDLVPGTDNGIILPNYAYANNKILFIGRNSTSGIDIFESDLTAAGTQLFYDFNLTSIGASGFYADSTFLIAAVNDCAVCQSATLYQYIGNTFYPITNANAETLRVNVPTATGIAQLFINKMGGEYYVVATTASTGREFYKINSLVTHQFASSTNSKIKIFPNPAFSFINCNAFCKAISLFDSSGRLIIKTENSSQLDIGNIVEGCYFVQTELPSGELQYQQIIICK